MARILQTNATEINSIMTSLVGGYQLTIADLSAYTNYGPP